MIHSPKWYNENKERLIKLYTESPKTSIRGISKDLGISESSLGKYFKKWGVKIKKRHNSIYNVDIHYFDEIDTEEKAYFLGLIVSDGHLSKEGTLMFTMKDGDILEKFKKSIKAEHPICKNSWDTPSIYIGCKEIAKSLRAMGITNRKSYSLDIKFISSFVPDIHKRDFVRGMVDGDGCIQMYKYKYLKKPQYHFGYTGLENVCEYVAEYLNMDRKFIDEKGISYTCVTRNPLIIKDIYIKLYHNSNVFIDRKMERFIEIMDEIEKNEEAS